MATLTRQMSSVLQIHADFSYGENHSYSTYNPISTKSGIYFSATVPSNPFNQPVYVAFPTNWQAPVTSNTISKTVTFGGTVRLPFDWLAHIDYQWSQSDAHTYSVGTSASVYLNTAPTYAGYIPGDNTPTAIYTGAINPFVDTLAYPTNWEPFAQGQYIYSRSDSNDLVIAASGPLAKLRWGSPRLSIRLEHNKSGEPDGNISAFAPLAPGTGVPQREWVTQYSYGQSQSADSANAELDLPIFKTTRPLLHSLDVQFNISYEKTAVGIGTPAYYVYPADPYQDTIAPGVSGVYIAGPNTLGSGSQPISSGAQPYRRRAVSSNRSITGPALIYKPTDDLLLRASVATGYVPPAYSQLLPNFTQSPSTTSITDPRNGKTYNVTYYYLGGNPNLLPQTSKSWNFGAIWEPNAGVLKGFRADAEFTETRQFDLIQVPSPQTVVNFESNFPGLVIRDPATGLINTVYYEYVNVAEAKQEAWTLTADYQLKTAIGSFGLTGAETIQEHNAKQIVSGTQFLEYVGYPSSAGVAKTKATGTLRWAFRNWTASWTTVYFDGYKQYGAPGDPGAYASSLEVGRPVTSLNTAYILPQGGYTIPSQIYQNLYLSYTFRRSPFGRGARWGRWADAFLANTKIGLTVNNVLNTLPPFDAYYSPFYTSPYGDIQLRNYSIAVRKAF